MKREDLKDMGLNDDQITSVLTAYSKDITPLKEQCNLSQLTVSFL